MFHKTAGSGELPHQTGALEPGGAAEPASAGAVAVSRRALTASAAAAALLLVGGGIARGQSATAQSPAHGTDDITLRLPAPTGPHRLGVTSLYLVNRSRRDPWGSIAVREVMVSVFYPARTVHGRRVAPQMTAGAAAAVPHIDPLFHKELPTSGVDWAATRTHAHTDAPAQAVRRPVLLYSPGGGDPRTLGTGLAEELASRGYVVVTIDHPGDASEVEFPRKRAGRQQVRTTVFRGNPRTDPKLFRTVVGTRIADTRFVLDQLALLAAGRNPDALGRPLPEALGLALDLRRVGIYGHSVGGTTAAQAMYEDRRIGAAVNLEGFLDYAPKRPGRKGRLLPVARYGVDRPLLLLGTDGFPERPALEFS